MPTMMRSVHTDRPGQVVLKELDRPTAGPQDVVVRIRACGICGTGTFIVAAGGMPVAEDRRLPIPLGHEPAGEVVEVGDEVVGLAVGDHVVINPMAAPSGLIGNGGPLGGLREYLLVERAVLGETLQKVPQDLPFEVAALNEPMAVAGHAVNRAAVRPGETAVVFGAGPIGLGAVIWLKLRGARHVAVVDVLPQRLTRAISVGADAVIDAAGSSQVIATTQDAARWGARLVVVAVHKRPVDISGILRSELTIVGSMGYPTELFEITAELAAHREKFGRLISHLVPFPDVQRAFDLALAPGASDKIVITLDD